MFRIITSGAVAAVVIGSAFAGAADALSAAERQGVTAAAESRRLPACEYEDGSGQRVCVWDARHLGNGHGRSFVMRRVDGEETFRYVTHRRAHRLLFG